jgi:hypothetical protein
MSVRFFINTAQCLYHITVFLFWQRIPIDLWDLKKESNDHNAISLSFVPFDDILPFVTLPLGEDIQPQLLNKFNHL